MVNLNRRVLKRIKETLTHLPYISGLYRENQLYRKNACYPPGHYYSPIVSVNEILEDKERIWDAGKQQLAGIDLRSEQQISLMQEFEEYYNDVPFPEEKSPAYRYYFKNGYYSFTDGLILYSFMRHFRPSLIMEAGSGFSSALMLDVNEVFLDGKTLLTFIEPYPERLNSLMREKENQQYNVIEKRIQDVPLNSFSELRKNDILFIDSTHISKTGSDVNFLMFEVLPTIRAGVIIHFHDVFFPFEYPEEWVTGGRNWNEVYLLKAFLMDNNKYEIMFFSHYMHLHFPEAYRNTPLAYKDHGCNFWLRKLQE